MNFNDIKTIDYEEILNDIDETTDMSILNIVLTKCTLQDSQLRIVHTFAMNKKIIDITDTGLGKTYNMLGELALLLPLISNPKKLAIVCVPNQKTEEFYNAFKVDLGCNVIAVSGRQERVDALKSTLQMSNVDIILCTPESFSKSLDFDILIYNLVHENKVAALLYDEADKMEDKGFLQCIEITNNFIPYASYANATPTGSASTYRPGSTEVLRVTYNLLYGLGALPRAKSYRSFFNKYTTMTGSHRNPTYTVNSEDILKDFGQYLANTNRTELGAETHFHPVQFVRCEPTKVQLEAMKNKDDRVNNILYSPETSQNPAFKLTPQNVPALKALMNILLQFPSDENKIVYVGNTAAMETISRILSTLGFEVMRLDGKVTDTPQKKDAMRIRFNESKGAVALINIKKGSNLGSAKHIIVYDTPADMLQYVARATRGFNSKTISFSMIYYPAYEQETMFNHLAMISTVNNIGERQTELIEPFMNELLEVYPTSKRWEAIIKMNQ